MMGEADSPRNFLLAESRVSDNVVIQPFALNRIKRAFYPPGKGNREVIPLTEGAGVGEWLPIHPTQNIYHFN